jgi:hypothetical protein
MNKEKSSPAQASDEPIPVPFPPMPLPVVKHAMLGGLFDRFAVQQYAMRYADLVVAAGSAQPAQTPAAPRVMAENDITTFLDEFDKHSEMDLERLASS